MRLAAVLRNLPIIHDQAVDDLANAGGRQWQLRRVANGDY